MGKAEASGPNKTCGSSRPEGCGCGKLDPNRAFRQWTGMGNSIQRTSVEDEGGKECSFP